MKALLLAPDAGAALAVQAGQARIARLAQALARAGFDDLVLAADPAGPVPAALGGTPLTVVPAGAHEADSIVRALPHLGDAPFVAVRADLHAPLFDFAAARGTLEERDAVGNAYAHDERDVAWLYLQPAAPGEADSVAMTLFSLSLDGEPRHGWAGVAVLRPEAFAGADTGGSLLAALRPQIARGRVGGEPLPGPAAPLTPALKGHPQ